MPRRNLTLAERKNIIENSEKHSVHQLALGNRISISQTYKIIAKKDYYLELSARVNNKLTKIRPTTDLLHDSKVLEYIDKYRAVGIPLNTNIVRKEAARLIGKDELLSMS